MTEDKYCVIALRSVCGQNLIPWVSDKVFDQPGQAEAEKNRVLQLFGVVSVRIVVFSDCTFKKALYC